jgi:hypothetical protein
VEIACSEVQGGQEVTSVLATRVSRKNARKNLAREIAEKGNGRKMGEKRSTEK